MGAPPDDAEACLAYLADNTSSWWAILGLSVLTGLLLVPAALSPYFTLKAVSRNALLLATTFVGLCFVLDLALTWTKYASGIALSAHDAAAPDPAQRANIVTAAAYPFSVAESSLMLVCNSLTSPWGFP